MIHAIIVFLKDFFLILGIVVFTVFVAASIAVILDTFKGVNNDR